MDRLPYFGGYWSFSAAEPQWWPTQISRLVGNNFGLYKCPSDKLPYQVPVRWVNGTLKMALSTTGTTQLAMTYRGSCDSLEDQNGKYLSRKITSWRYPGRNILLVEAEAQDLRMDPNALHECFRLSDNLKCLDDSDPRYVANWKSPYFQEWKRHVGRTNILFLDGHVDRLTPRQASKLGKWQEHYLVPPT
jgi:prepilin-type processing-associated H-X9-DG protein